MTKKTKNLTQLIPLTLQFMIARARGDEELTKKIAKYALSYASSRNTRGTIIEDIFNYVQEDLTYQEITRIAVAAEDAAYPGRGINFAKKYGGDIEEVEEELVRNLARYNCINKLSNLELTLKEDQILDITNNVFENLITTQGEGKRYNINAALSLAEYHNNQEQIKKASAKLFESNLLYSEFDEDKNKKLTNLLAKKDIEEIAKNTIHVWLRNGQIIKAKTIASKYAPRLIEELDDIQVSLNKYQEEIETKLYEKDGSK